MGPSTIFHSAQDRGGGGIENLAYPIDLYAKTILENVIDQPFLFLRYLDPRNGKLRSHYGTEFLPFPVPRLLKSSIENTNNLFLQFFEKNKPDL